MTISIYIYLATNLLSIYLTTNILSIYLTNNLLSIYLTTNLLSIYLTSNLLSIYQTTNLLSIYLTTNLLSIYLTNSNNLLSFYLRICLRYETVGFAIMTLCKFIDQQLIYWSFDFPVPIPFYTER